MKDDTFKSISALIVAGGTGTRFGLPTNKTLVPLRNRPVIAWTLDPFLEHPLIDEIILVIHPRDRKTIDSLELEGWSFPESVQLVDGGPDRASSVHNGLLATTCAADDLILIHDGARPFVSIQDLDRIIESSRSACGSLLTLPFTETFKEIDENGHILQTPDRSHHRIAQTPQGFRRNDLIRAHEEAKSRNLSPTDSASAIEIFRTCPRCQSPRKRLTLEGETYLSCSQHPRCSEKIVTDPIEHLDLHRLIEEPIQTAQGRPENIKITTSEDIQRIEFLLARNDPRE
ncbi:MAG: IspD/TarI family cytidylyltransferase [Planctomycetota bacterium]|nr:IspD/TarI family cytidylyltransferase [Planctomycetota bacterium]